jgi:hypothetical protein
MKFKLIFFLSTILAMQLSTSGKATQLVTNGDFETGDFTGWTLFSTSNGSLGASPLPRVSSFDVTGNGPTTAAQFQVGEVNFTSFQEGGGLRQSITTTAGIIQFSADIAALGATFQNYEAGVFTVLLNGITEGTVDLGLIDPQETIRQHLGFSSAVSAGAQDVEILITRPYTNGFSSALYDSTPLEYVTGISAVESVPEPSTWVMMVLGFAGIGFTVYRQKSPLGITGTPYPLLTPHPPRATTAALAAA